MSPDKLIHKLIYMANQIAKYFAAQKSIEPADGVASHLAKFWDPSMRAKILTHMENGGEGLDPLTREAVRRLGAMDLLGSGSRERRPSGG